MSTDQTASTAQLPTNYLDIQTADGLDYQLEIAGLGARSHAYLIDWQIRLLLAITWLLSCSLLIENFALKQLVDAKQLTEILHSTQVFILLVPPALVYFLYHPILEIVMAGRTPGKRMAGVRLVNIQGQPPGIAAILLRNLFRLIDSLPFFYLVGMLTVAVTRQHVRIGDLAGSVVLVYEQTVNPKTLAQLTQLTINTQLNSADQALLLDIRARWRDLSAERRIQYAEQFLQRIGQPLPTASNPRKLQKALKKTLDNLLTHA